MSRNRVNTPVVVVGVLVAAALSGCGAGGPVELPAGFTGTTKVSGRFGGTTDARTWSADCRGYVSTSPDHEVQNAGELPYVRFVVNGGSLDTTLVVQLPDGTYRCNDDADGRNPIVEGPLPAGLTKVWVGGYNSGTVGNYRLGITTVSTTTPDSLGPPAANTRTSSRSSRRRRP